ncbi:MAG: AbgT family transporter [Thermoanaerobaculia bacterium]
MSASRRDFSEPDCGCWCSPPQRLLTLILVLAGVLRTRRARSATCCWCRSGAFFHAAGRHPVVGIAAAFAGVSGGYSANVILGTVDPLLSGITQEAAADRPPRLPGESGLQLLLHGGFDLPDLPRSEPGRPRRSSRRAGDATKERPRDRRSRG